MSQIIKAFLTLGFALAIQPALAIPSKPEIVETQISQTPNRMVQLLDAWGFKTTSCRGNVSFIRHDITGEKACVVPNSEIKAGKFVYDSTNNQIHPESRQEASNYKTEPATKEVATKEIVFDFTNSYDYSSCLDNILLAYENRQSDLRQATKNKCANDILNTFGHHLSKEFTLELITSADDYATKHLDIKLYPTFGLRRRVAINFGYVYALDRNNEDILKYISVNQ